MRVMKIALVSVMLCIWAFSQQATPAQSKTADRNKPSPGAHKTKIPWANAATFDCKQEQGLMTTWAGQLGKPDHEDIGTYNANNYMACRATAATDSDVPPACYVIFENDVAHTIPSRWAMQGPNHGDQITLSCNGKQPTCCQLQMWPSRAAAEKSGKK